MPVCINCKQSTNNTQFIKCSGCMNSLHTSCIGLQGDDASRITRMRSKNVKVLCNTCSNEEDKLDQLKQFLTNLVDTKLQELERKIANINTTIHSEHQEDIIEEAMDRINRSHNIILYNVPETNSAVEDNNKVNEILITVQGDNVNPISSRHVHRIGKRSNKARPIKVTFSTPAQAKSFLRAKNKLATSTFSTISISDDKTPRQREYMNKLRTELKRRTDHGEQNLTIKYVRGRPTLVSKTDGSLN
uniref:Uncharacterized protein LOC114325130 isoform X1 n=1 Tax=Diabrotica virgifera virgifera TaxID=50390 RepID=A0A6P7F0R6_DIAVI